MILSTTRLTIRELDSKRDADFICRLLNTPKFIKYIGDRKVRTAEDAADFIERRYRQSYHDHGYGLYAVDLNANSQSVGICGFVKRPHFDFADIGFAFLPEHEGCGYGYESALAMLGHGRDVLGFSHVLAITSQDNDASGKLLEKLGFTYSGLTESPDGETLKLFEIDL